MGISQYRLAKSIGVPQRRIGEIVAGKRSITANTALRLARFFGTDAQSWITCKRITTLTLPKNVWPSI
ncbi:MAG: HigA family addiction module antitoxin [Syntrophaceae bacterium]